MTAFRLDIGPEEGGGDMVLPGVQANFKLTILKVKSLFVMHNFT